jgi:hypothetical protein
MAVHKALCEKAFLSGFHAVHAAWQHRTITMTFEQGFQRYRNAAWKEKEEKISNCKELSHIIPRLGELI